jgi:hypothetical protein
MSLCAAVEVLRQRIFDAFANLLGKRRSDLDVLARNPNLHESHVYGNSARFGSRILRPRTLPKKSGGP